MSITDVCTRLLMILICWIALLNSAFAFQCPDIEPIQVFLHKEHVLELYPAHRIQLVDPRLVQLGETEDLGNSTIRIKMKGMVLGRSELIVYPAEGFACPQIPFTVVPKKRTVDFVFDYTTIVLVIIASLLMGALLEAEKCRECLTSRNGLKAAVVCLICQWVILPPLSLGISRLFRYSDLQTIGVFAVACSPIGTKSQQWTVLLDGDVNLSVVLTCLSTFFSFITMPLWMLTLPRIEFHIRVPFVGLLRTLSFVVLPYIFAIGLTHWKPQLRVWARRVVKPILILVLIFFVSVGVYASWPLFTQLHWTHALSAPMIQWTGCLIGYCVAALPLRLQWPQALTFALSVGYQNIAVAFLLVRHNFAQPESDIASTVVLVIAAMGSIPLWIGLVVKRIYAAIQKRRNRVEETKHEAQDKPEKRRLFAPAIDDV